MSHEGVVKYDERGVMDGGTMGLPRKIDRDIWLKEVFPEWGTYLNYEIDTFEVKPGTGALWYFGAMSCALKSQSGAVFLVDLYAGPSMFTTIHTMASVKQVAPRSCTGYGRTPWWSTHGSSRG